MLTFHAKGHADITALDNRTLSFSTDETVLPCTLGVLSDFDKERLKSFMRHSFDFFMHIIVGDESVSLHAQYKDRFDAINVSRVMDIDGFGMASSHSASDIPRSMITLLQDPAQEVRVHIEKTA